MKFEVVLIFWLRTECHDHSDTMFLVRKLCQQWPFSLQLKTPPHHLFFNFQLKKKANKGHQNLNKKIEPINFSRWLNSYSLTILPAPNQNNKGRTSSIYISPNISSITPLPCLHFPPTKLFFVQNLYFFQLPLPLH